MDVKDSDIYPKYTFRLSHTDKEWLNRELDELKEKFNAGIDGEYPVITKNVLLISALKRGLRFFREGVKARCVHQNLEVMAEASRVWDALTNPVALAAWWHPGTVLEARFGGKFFQPWTGTDGSDHSVTGVVTEIVPNELIQFTWKERTWKDEEETVCCVRLREGFHGGTRIEIVHSGWEVFPEAQVAMRRSEFEARWGSLLSRLAEVLAQG